MATIGMIGAGNIGSTLAHLARDTGHRVILSNRRGPHTLDDLAQQLGPHVSTGTTHQTAVADVVVITIPLYALASLPDDLGRLLAGKVLIDTMNHYPERDGVIPALDQHGSTTSGLTQSAFPGAHVVKGFNNIVHSHLLDLARPHGDPTRSTLPIASDDEAAKETVTTLMDDLGYDALDAGPLAEGWRFERGQPAYCLPYAADPEALRASRPGHRPTGTRPASAADLRTALSRATPTWG